MVIVYKKHGNYHKRTAQVLANPYDPRNSPHTVIISNYSWTLRISFRTINWLDLSSKVDVL